MMRLVYALLPLALLLAQFVAPTGATAASQATAAEVDAAVEALLALPYNPAYQPQGTDSAFDDDDYPSAFPATDTTTGSCCTSPTPDQPPLADLAPPFAEFGDHFDRIQLTSADGTPLHAFVAVNPGAPGIVVAHGFNTNGKHSIVRYAAFLAANGFSVIAPDHRDMGREWVRGGSWHPSGERRGQTLGWKESEDFLAAAAELRRRGAPAVGMLGLSEGAQNTVLAVARDHDGLIDAVMTFSAPADQSTQAQRNEAATAALLTTVVNNPDLCGYLAQVGAREEFTATPNFILRQDSAIDALDGVVGGAPVAVPGVHFYAQDDTLVEAYHATMLASRTLGLDTHRTVLVRAGNHAYFYDRWWVQAATLSWFRTWLDPAGQATTAEPTVAQTPGGPPLAEQTVDLSGTTREDGDAERSPVDACPPVEDRVGPTALGSVEVTGPAEVTVDARRSYSGWDDHRLTGWQLDLGDGLVLQGSDLLEARVVHTYDQPGVYDIAVTVTDDTGGQAISTHRTEVPGVLERVGGVDRLATAREVASAVFGEADTVVLASAGSFPDALAAAPLAFQLGSPVLLVGSEVDEPLLIELERLRALRVRIIGGEAAVPAAVTDALAAAGYAVQRTAGPDRFATAAAVASDVGGAAGRAVVVSGHSFADAVAGSALAARSGMPLVLVEPDAVPAATAEVLASLGIEETVVVGGSAAVSDAVAASVGAVQRLAGVDRYATAAAAASASLGAGLDPATTWLATGEDFPDALAVGVAAARDGAVLLLVDGDDGDPWSSAWLADHPVRRLVVAGGTAAVTDAVAATAASVLG